MVTKGEYNMIQIIKTIVIIIFFTLAGCSNYVPEKVITTSIRMCLENDGIDYIKTHPMTWSVHCKNGASFKLNVTGDEFDEK